jgi:hypothetical protein
MIAPLRLEGCAPVGGKAVDQPWRSEGILVAAAGASDDVICAALSDRSGRVEHHACLVLPVCLVDHRVGA